MAVAGRICRDQCGAPGGARTSFAGMGRCGRARFCRVGDQPQCYPCDAAGDGDHCREIRRMNELYAEFKDEAGDLLTAVVVKLSLPDPYDLTDIDLSEYKGVVAPWNNWRAVQAQCASLAAALIAPPRV